MNTLLRTIILAAAALAVSGCEDESPPDETSPQAVVTDLRAQLAAERAARLRAEQALEQERRELARERRRARIELREQERVRLLAIVLVTALACLAVAVVLWAAWTRRSRLPPFFSKQRRPRDGP